MNWFNNFRFNTDVISEEDLGFQGREIFFLLRNLFFFAENFFFFFVIMRTESALVLVRGISISQNFTWRPEGSFNFRSQKAKILRPLTQLLHVSSLKSKKRHIATLQRPTVANYVSQIFNFLVVTWSPRFTIKTFSLEVLVSIQNSSSWMTSNWKLETIIIAPYFFFTILIYLSINNGKFSKAVWTNRKTINYLLFVQSIYFWGNAVGSNQKCIWILI